MADIYQDVPLLPDEKIGHINQSGHIYAYLEDNQEEYLGWVDYEEGVIYAGKQDDEEVIEMGWIEESGDVFATYEDGEERLGYVDENGKLYAYTDEGDDYLGQVTGMTDAAEGAAAILFFFDEEEEI
jgi:hypothetical protein